LSIEWLPRVQQQAAPPAAPPKKPVHVFVAIPTHGTVGIRWALRLHQILDAAPYQTTYAADWHYGVAESREHLAEAALATESVTHVMFMDSDVMPDDIDVINRLLAADLPIVSGLYRNTLGSGVNAWMGPNTIALKQQAPIVEVERVGFGLVMVKREVFEAIKERPWFYLTAGKSQQGEDFYFCRKARNAGFKVCVDMRVQAKHVQYVEASVGS
jgi:hypothetical protein